MTLSIDGHPGDVSPRVRYLSARSPVKATSNPSRAKRVNDPWACQTEGQVADLKRRVPTLKRVIADCDRLAANLDQEVRNEEHRVKVHGPANIAYSTYAKAAASRRDNLRRSADELRAHLAKAEKQNAKVPVFDGVQGQTTRSNANTAAPGKLRPNSTPDILERLQAHRRVAHGVRDAGMPEVVLQPPGIHPAGR
jgi:flagellar protein FliJ